MPEMINVARLAELVSEDFFRRLGWEVSGPPNESWVCTNPEVHLKRDHPTDVTFVYQDPYTQRNVHLLTDLKSYAASSLKSFPLKETLENLASAVDCAKSNPNWKELYLKGGWDYEIQGLLFIYNHDKAYDREFSEMLALASDSGLVVPKGVKINVLSPKDIWHIGDMINDMKSLMADGVIPSRREDTPFYYHSYSRDRLSEKASHPAATIDMLLGQYQSMTYVRKASNGNSTRGLLLYYKGKGEDVKEFILLLDMLRAYGHLDTQDEIMIRCPGSSPKAAVNFNKAKMNYGSYPGGEVPETLIKIKFDSVSNVSPRISQYEVAYGGK